MQTHHRAQTASLHRQKHQQAMLKQIKSAAKLARPSLYHHRSTLSSQLKTRPSPDSKPAHTENSLTLPQQLQQLLKIRGKKTKQFSLEKDQKKVCAQGWAEFAEKVEVETHQDLRTLRGRAQRLKKRATVGSICTREGLSPQQASRCEVGGQSLGQLLGAMRGQSEGKAWLKSAQVEREVKGSLVLSNAYRACLQSKNYQSAQQWSGQTLNAWVFLRQNGHRLPQKQLGDLYRSNWLLP